MATGSDVVDIPRAQEGPDAFQEARKSLFEIGEKAGIKAQVMEAFANEQSEPSASQLRKLHFAAASWRNAGDGEANYDAAVQRFRDTSPFRKTL